MSGRNWVDVSIQDEPQNRRYLVRLFYSIDEYDPGDSSTPAFAGAVQFEDAQVREAAQFDFEGQPTFVDRGVDASKYLDRVWQLLDSSSSLREQVNAACWTDFQSTPPSAESRESNSRRL